MRVFVLRGAGRTCLLSRISSWVAKRRPHVPTAADRYWQARAEAQAAREEAAMLREHNGQLREQNELLRTHCEELRQMVVSGTHP